MKASRTAGPLLIIGGAEDKKGDMTILREFVRLAGGARARVVVIAVASSAPDEVGAQYVELFHRLGARHAEVLAVASHEQANQPASSEAVEHATAVFFTGGDQLRITNLLGGTRTDRALHRRHEEGMVLGGTSAGAAMMSNTMILDGASEATPRVGNVKLGTGMEFLAGTIIDQHFGQRGRGGRLLSALAQYPHLLGIGIDENTAIVVHEDQLEVLGAGAVTIFDAGDVTYNDVLELRDQQHVALCGVKLHILPAGFGFDLQSRTPVLKPTVLHPRKAAGKEKPSPS